MKRQQPIRKVSTKRAKQMRAYKLVRSTYLVENSICECVGCYQPSTDVHHMKGRSGDRLVDEEFFLAVCRSCHMEIENQPIWAKKMGYSISRLEI